MIVKNQVITKNQIRRAAHVGCRRIRQFAVGKGVSGIAVALVISLFAPSDIWAPAAFGQQARTSQADPSETQSSQAAPPQAAPPQAAPPQAEPSLAEPSLIAAPQPDAPQILPTPFETADIGGESFAIGSLSVAEGALPSDLWRGTSRRNLEFLFSTLPRRYLRPAYLDILRRTLLTAGAGPEGADDALAGQKLMILAEAGFFEEASSLAALASGLQVKPDLAQAIAYSEMMRGEMSAACARGAGLREGRGQAFWLKLRVLCFSLNDEKAAADVTIGLLQDQNALTASELKLFRALTQSGQGKTSITPHTGFEYAAIRALKQPLALSELGKADGAVWRAIALEEGAPPQARIMAAEQAVYFGIMTAQDLAALFRSFEFQTAQLIEVKSRLKTREVNRLIDPLAYQAVRELGSSENSLDIATMVGHALLQAEDAARFTALAGLYVPMIRQTEVIVNYVPYAEIFVLAGIVSRDAGVIDRWIGALALDQSNPDGRKTASALLSMLALIAPDLSANLAQRYGLEVTLAPNARRVELGLAAGGGEAAFARLLDLGFDASIHSKKAQSVLVALSMAGLHSAPDSVLAAAREVTIYQTLVTAGLESVLGELAFDRTLRVYLPRVIRAADVTPLVGEAVRNSTSSTISAASAKVTPRVKPAPKGAGR